MVHRLQIKSFMCQGNLYLVGQEKGKGTEKAPRSCDSSGSCPSIILECNAELF